MSWETLMFGVVLAIVGLQHFRLNALARELRWVKHRALAEIGKEALAEMEAAERSERRLQQRFGFRL